MSLQQSDIHRHVPADIKLQTVPADIRLQPLLALQGFTHSNDTQIIIMIRNTNNISLTAQSFRYCLICLDTVNMLSSEEGCKNIFSRKICLTERLVSKMD